MPTGINHRPRVMTWLFRVAFIMLLLLSNIPSALANLSGSPFDAADGNLVLNDETQDWANAPNLAKALDKPTGQQDDSFGQGTKEDDAVPTVTDGSIPNNKSDLTRFYVANQKVGANEFLYLAWERVQEPSGTTNMDFEFNQSKTLSSNGVTPVRTAGDVLIKYDLAQGGTNPILGFHRWITAASAGGQTAAQACEAANSFPCWGKVQPLTGFFEGSINTVIVTDPIAPDAPRTLSVRTFGEAAINLTTSGILPAGTCAGFGRAYLKSRSSDSFTAAIKDFIAPIEVNIQNCGRIIVRKQTNPDGAAGTFGFTTTGGLTPSSFNLDDDGVRDYGATVQAGSYTVTENDPTPGFDLTSISCTVTGAAGTSTTTTSLATRSVSISLSATDTVDCTFTNRARGTIIVEKQTDPDGATGTFTFTGDAAGTISDGEKITVNDLAPGTYTATEDDPTPGFDLVSIVCDDANSTGNVATRTATFELAAGETVTCVFTNRQRGTINVHKEDDDGTALAGAVFTLFKDSAPLGGTRGAEDTTTGLTCTTDAAGDCSFSNVVAGRYWVVETTGVPGYGTAADQNVTLGAGATVALTFVNPQLHTVIVLVCHQATNTLAASDVTRGTTTKTSLSGLGLTPAQQAALCALGGARFTDLPHGNQTLTVNVGNNAHP